VIQSHVCTSSFWHCPVGNKGVIPGPKSCKNPGLAPLCDRNTTFGRIAVLRQFARIAPVEASALTDEQEVQHACNDAGSSNRTASPDDSVLHLSKIGPCQSLESYGSWCDLQDVPMPALQYSDVSEALPSLRCRSWHTLYGARPLRTML